MRRSIASLSLGLGLLGSCTSAEPGDVTSVSGTVVGVVTDPAHAPVAGAVVRAVAVYTLPAGPTPVAVESTFTAADGRYRLVLGAPLTPPDTAQLEVQVRPPAERGLTAIDTTGLRLVLGDGRDSTRVDVQLRAPAP